jgi:cell volume regulation protein A
MQGDELTTLAVTLLVASVLVVACAAASRLAARAGLPAVVLFLGLGMLAGSEGIGGLAFDDHAFAFRIGVIALLFILFDGGLNTPLSTVKRFAGPATTLATLGVLVTTAILAAGARLAGFSWTEGLLLGAIVSSTDAAAVFSVLRSGGLRPRERISATLELESGLNDPMAVLLTVTLTESLLTGRPLAVTSLGFVVVSLALGGIVGALVALAGRFLLARFRVPASGLYPLLTIALGCAAFGAASVVHGSGFLAVYVAGVLLGDARLPYRAAVIRVHDFLGWSAQLVMFLVLGLLVYPSRMSDVAPEGVGLALLVCFVARPFAVVLCLLPFRYPVREILYIAWGGLKGAVPIVLAIIPILAQVPGGRRIFDVVFFVVLVSALLQGSMMRPLALRLRVGKPAPPSRNASLEIVALRPTGSDLLTFDVSSAAAVCGVKVSEIPFPPKSSAMLIVRGDELVAPRGETSSACTRTARSSSSCSARLRSDARIAQTHMVGAVCGLRAPPACSDGLELVCARTCASPWRSPRSR